MLRTRDINAPLAGTANLNVPGSGARPFGSSAGDIYLYESSGQFRQRQIISNVSARVNTKLTLFGFYAFGHANGNTDGAQSIPAYQYNLSTEWSRSSFDVHHRAFIGGSITPKWGISFSPFVMLSTGNPFNIVLGRDLNGDGILTDRPAFASSSTTAANLRVTKWGYFDVNPLAGSTAIIPRNYGDGPGMVSVNLRVSRTWSFGKKPETAGAQGGPEGMRGGMMMGGGPPGGGGPRGGGGGGPRGGGGGMFGGGGSGKYNLSVSANARNLINHVNLAPPIGNLSSPSFGQSTSLAGGFGPFASGAAGNRKLELQVRFTF